MIIATHPRSLLETLQGMIERTYDMDTRVRDIGRFVVGDMGYPRVLAGSRVVRRVGAGMVDRLPALLVRQEGSLIQATLYYPDWLIRRLEEHPPLGGLTDRNLDAFSWFVEELDHLLFLADRVRQGRPVSLLELEFHANVTKDLVARLFLARGRADGRLRDEDRSWLQSRLYNRYGLGEMDPEIRDRYLDAARYAFLYMKKLESFRLRERLPELRRHHRRTWQEHLRFLNRLPLKGKKKGGE